jgi:hypothetical protein
MEPASDSPATAPELAPEVQQLIRSEQERGYRNLAIKLGLGADPKKAYERLSGTPLSETSHSPYEAPKPYRIMTIILGNVQKALAAAGQEPLSPTPALATLPSGDVNARVLIESKTLVPVIFFEQGLFPFFMQFCHLIGWVAPPFSLQLLSDDKAIMQMANHFTMPLQASTSFVDLFATYTFAGRPMVDTQIPPPPHNMPLCMALLSLMERFVLVHELGHIKFGHLHDSIDQGQELDADAWSLAVVTYMTRNDAVGWGVGYWACELALIALNLLYRAIGIAEFGGKKLSWIDKSHPDPLARRESLRQYWVEPGVDPAGIGAARELCGMSDALILKLWEFAAAAQLLSHQQGARPSPLWRTLIDSTFVASN